ncbi:alpha/beta hydrolase [Dysgonomonas sp. 216]|uniref:alpha/beta hydrolase n=1 Tax=Dysgonomonas sp. 216 TaxID=2302934 RepID=UPI0013D06EB1|nr:alpha/beta hydrolase [Dysgonomonas sp. 216]NDW17564.1 alpha/beta hydrolase [Dysgonomonas sp. 216]
MKELSYSEDILRYGFEQYTINLKDDYEGHAVATLIRRNTSSYQGKAILYIHGFNDYFFQQETAIAFNNKGYNFYALDLRKYGRSLLPHQKMNDIRNLRSYYEEIAKALDIIHSEDNKEVILFGHSTGGLILTLFAKEHPDSPLFDGVMLNSPFFDFNKKPIIKRLIPIFSALGKLFPGIKINGGFSKEYGMNLHKEYSGEWNYNLEWKPNTAPRINLGWLRAIYRAQQLLQKQFTITHPVLILHSSQSTNNYTDKEQMQTMDSILNVRDIARMANKINGNVEVTAIEGGIHDLVLSKKNIREQVYDTIFTWLKKQNL